MLPVCLPKQFFSINSVYSLQISADYFHICPHTVLCFRQTLFSFMVFPYTLTTFVFSRHCGFTLDPVIPLQWWSQGPAYTPRRCEGSKVDLHGNTLAHSQRSNFQPVLNFKHMSNLTCFTEITHVLKIKACFAAVLEWEQRALTILHQAH